MEMLEVGGCVRDKYMGRKSNDIDYSVVLDSNDPFFNITNDPFKVMRRHLLDMGFEIFLETPEHLTIRARFPDSYFTKPAPVGNALPVLKREKGLTADFVLARKEGTYTDGRRPDSVEVGTLPDDLARRDFTMNAIAEAADGSVIDPFNGRRDIDQRIIRAVSDPFQRLSEDALRAVRALRFSVVLGFDIAPSVKFAMESAAVLDSIENKISDDRIMKELGKMFRFDTVASLRALNEFKTLTEAMFSGSVSLDATMKTKGRGK